MCVICDGKTYEENWDWFRDTISRNGWAIQGVEGEIDRDGVHPAFAYTIGFTRHRLPEIVITGRTFEEAGDVLNELGRSIRGGRLLVPGARVRAGNLELMMLPVVDTEDVLITAHQLYKGRKITALQAVWADPDGRLPWEQTHPDDVTQPLVGQRPRPL